MQCGRRNRRPYAVAAVAVAVAAVVACALLMRCAGREDDGDDASVPRTLRPGATYKATVFPERHAERPQLPFDRHVAGGEDDGSGIKGEEPQDDEVVEIPSPVDPDDPNMAGFARGRDFAEDVWALVEGGGTNEIVELAMGLLAGDNAEDRVFGGVLLALADSLDGEAFTSILLDEDVRVPLAVLDWLRDYCPEDRAAAFKEAFSVREESLDDLYLLAKSDGALGGRSALDLWLEGYSHEDAAAVDALAALAVSPDASYDVRQQAFFKLLEPETKDVALKLMDRLGDGFGGGSSPLADQAAQKLADIAEISNIDGDDEKIWDSEAPVVYYLATSEDGLPARDLANYLEYALRRDDPDFPPIVEEGTWEFANEFMERVQPHRETLMPEEQEALDRIAVQLERLVDYDPAFNPFETVEDDGDEDDEENDGNDGNDGNDEYEGYDEDDEENDGNDADDWDDEESDAAAEDDDSEDGGEGDISPFFAFGPRTKDRKVPN